ncbi:hypothetical protein BC939DRAFT_399555 [Gamsiella multidivaricata]|uniref:uncharacterized protein n=1 Tax=Gamsiella multidivaricata TaxID=101098 RepID=UPI00221F5689|nr:uncharacterized protein BC939DRAFT_399555 [Gamsiella multidivaricata]KAI7820261.1 hypothetical protein BC939DRAFT_399555 [Gamsiella multidivaricata]
MDSTPSGLVAKSAHRTSRDGFDPLQVTGRRKNKTDFEIKNGVLNGSANADANASTEEKSDALKQEGASPSPSIQQQQQKAESARSPTPSQTNSAQPRSGKKPHHELLTEAEKKANHIASEQKRRQNIRVGFDSLVEIVPELGDSHRSEAVILQKSVEYIHRLLNQKNELKSRVRELQVHLGDPVDDFDSVSASFCFCVSIEGWNVLFTCICIFVDVDCFHSAHSFRPWSHEYDIKLTTAHTVGIGHGGRARRITSANPLALESMQASINFGIL